MYRFKKVCFGSMLAAFVLPYPCLAERGEYKVKEQGPDIEVTSPWGTKTYTGETRLDVMRNYRIEIPIKDLQPAGAEDDYDDWYDADEWLALETEVDGVETPPAAAPLAAATPPEGPAKVEEKPAKQESRDADIDETPRLVVEANRFYNQGKYYEALLYVEEILRKRPQYVRAWIMKGSLLHIQGHRDLAHEAWQTILSFDPENKQVKDLLSRYR